MERLAKGCLASMTAPMLALVLGTVTSDAGVSPGTIRTDALGAAGLIFVAIACGSLINRRRK